LFIFGGVRRRGLGTRSVSKRGSRGMFCDFMDLGPIGRVYIMCGCPKNNQKPPLQKMDYKKNTCVLQKQKLKKKKKKPYPQNGKLSQQI
ncbi:hypothetical protein, partial [Lacticaseibacillus rhamnosus]|uniref:hypothetical protein n=1 Tax=Lacticaseibacillus rhamnosus TaxID=47715 RepID=UPI001CDC9602